MSDDMTDQTSTAEEARKLLDNGWRLVVFRDGLGSYSAFAVRDGDSLDAAIEEWDDYDPMARDPVPTPAEAVYDGPNRYCGCGVTVAGALHAVTEKVILRRLP